MYGQIPSTKSTADRMKGLLEEGKVYVIKKFFCNESRTTYRPVESPFMVQFTRFTTIEARPGVEESFPFCTYNLTAFTDIPKPSTDRFIGKFYILLSSHSIEWSILTLSILTMIYIANFRLTCLTRVLSILFQMLSARLLWSLMSRLFSPCTRQRPPTQGKLC